MAKIKISGKLEVRDGTGTKTPTFHTGHGAGAPKAETVGAGMRKAEASMLTPGKTLKKLQGPTPSAYGYNGQNRFVQPTRDSSSMPSGLGNPRL